MIQQIRHEHPDDDQPLPARMVNEYCYCPRLFYLEYVDGLFAHNADTVGGVARHARVDKAADELPAGGADAKKARSSRSRKKSAVADSESAAPADAANQPPSAPEPIHARSVTLASERYGVLAKLDLVEADGDLATPVDYKAGAPRKLEDGSLGAWEPEQVQLCIQALVLREHGYRCEEGILFFWKTRQRVRIPMDAALVELTERMISGARDLIASRRIPPPLVDSPKCPRCSLVGICLPDETNARELRAAGPNGERCSQLRLFDSDLSEEFAAARGADGQDSFRQLVTARDDRRPLYLNTQGLSVGKSGEVLQVRDKARVIQEARLRDVNQVNLFGSIQVSTQAIQGLLQAEIPLIYFSMGGWFYGMTQPVGLKNILWRREQFRLADSNRFCLALAKQLVLGKLKNQRTMLMRNHIEPPAEALRALKALQFEAQRVGTLGELLGIEGAGARAYFQSFAGMLKLGESEGEARGHGGDGRVQEHARDEVAAGHDAERRATLQAERGGEAWRRFDFAGRNRRPPRDPLNALLSLGYSLLTKDLTITCAAVGLDPYLGFYHQPRFGRPALALDLMEPFRPLIVDSAVLSAVNQRMVTLDHFVAAGNAVALTAEGRKAFFLAYEQRMDSLVTHPNFGYRVSYRRMLEIQTRLLARLLLGEIWTYPVFVTR